MGIKYTKIKGFTVKMFRKKLRMTQVEFATFIGVPTATLAAWETRGVTSRLAIVMLLEVYKKSNAIFEAIRKYDQAILDVRSGKC